MMKPYLNVLSLIIFLLLPLTNQAQLIQREDATDSFNALIWNRDNFLRGGSEVDRGDWYEWWYFKLIDQKTKTPFYFVYGVTNPWDLQNTNPNSKAFVQFGHFGDNWIIENDFSVQNFAGTYNKMNVQITDENRADEKSAVGHIRGISNRGTTHDVRWNLRTTLDWNFKAMGWTMGLDWSSSIYWYPAQASLIANGEIEVDGKTYIIENAQGYQDRNWGRNFPKWWAWIVANSFKDSPQTRFAGGGGLPKVVNAVEIPIFVMGLRHDGKEHSFRLNDGDQVRMNIKFGKWYVEAFNKKGYKVIVEGHAPKEKFMDLIFRTPQGYLFHDWETLNGNLRVRLYKRSLLKWNLIADLHSDEAGLEYGSPNENPETANVQLGNF